MAGTRDAAVDQFDDLLNASANRVRKTKVDVRSENARRFREMFDKGEVPEPGNVGSSATGADKTIADKEHELEMMRRTKRQQKEFFRKMESGQLDEEDGGASAGPKEPKLLVGRITKTADGDIGGEVPELASLSNRFSFFEHYEEKAAEAAASGSTAAAGKKGGKTGRASPSAECKARNVLSKFKEMESRVLNGEDEGELGEQRVEISMAVDTTGIV